jgi:hypothetical protein
MHVPHARTKAETIYYLLALAGRAPMPPVDYRAPRPRYGYSIREVTFLGMPFGWYTEMGYALYTDDRWELVVAKLIDPAEVEFRKEIGRDPTQGFLFPFWAHAWGWLYVAALATWGWLFHRAVVRRREELGII